MTALDDLAADLGVDAGVLSDRLTGAVADAIAANYLTQDAQGRVGANFAGHVKASGVDLPEAAAAPYTPSAALDWLDPAGVVREYVQGSLVGQYHRLGLFSDPNAAPLVGITLDSAPAPANPTDGLIQLAAGGLSALLFRSDGSSDFLQLGAASARWKVNVGEVTVPANGFTDVAHGLSVVPSVILPGTHFNGGVSLVRWSIESPMPDNAHFRIHNDNAGAATNVFWLAIAIG